MRIIYAIVTLVLSYNNNTNYYIVEYSYENKYCKDTLILPKRMLNLNDTIQYQPKATDYVKNNYEK